MHNRKKTWQSSANTQQQPHHNYCRHKRFWEFCFSIWLKDGITSQGLARWIFSITQTSFPSSLGLNSCTTIHSACFLLQCQANSFFVHHLSKTIHPRTFPSHWSLWSFKQLGAQVHNEPLLLIQVLFHTSLLSYSGIHQGKCQSTVFVKITKVKRD